MDIIKQLDKTVRFYQNGRVIQTLLPNVTANLNRTRNGIILEDVTGRSIEIYTSQIDETQKLPAPSIKFQPGNTVDLWDLLFDPSTTPFFTELHIKFGGGGGGLPTKSGIVAAGSFVGPGIRTAPVLFAAAFSDNLYSVVVTGEDRRIWSISGKSSAGFTISANSAAALGGNTFWQAIKQGET